MESGTVKWFNNAKGWGFLSRISPDGPDGEGDGTDVFIHYSQIEGEGYRTLKEGDRVIYELCQGPRGQFAQNVQIPDSILDVLQSAQLAVEVNTQVAQVAVAANVPRRSRELG